MNIEHDVIVIGAGPAGENAAARAVAGGLTAAIVERELVGGECSYYACMPSKALLRPGEVLAAARRAPGAAQAITGKIDVAAALARRDALAANWDDAGQVGWLDGADVDLIRGHGRLSGERAVDVQRPDGTVVRYQARTAVIIATGSGAARPPIRGLTEVGVWDNRDITTVEEVPRRLAVVGGGVVGSEMAQAWKWLGAEEVTIIEMADRLLPREEPFAGAELAAALQRMDIDVLTDCEVTAVHRDREDGPATVTFDGGPGRAEADEVLIAVGRRPRTSDVGLEHVGLQPGTFIEVDDNMRATGVPGGWLYAVGDVNGRALLTHTGKYQARVAGDHIAGKDAAAWSDRTAIPRVVFTDPQIAAVGLTERQARDAGIAVRTVQHNTGHVAGAATLGRGIRGTSQLVIDDDRRVIVGATFVGPGVGEMLHAATVAIVGEVSLDRLWHAVPAFPTMSEIWLRFLESYGL